MIQPIFSFSTATFSPFSDAPCAVVFTLATNCRKKYLMIKDVVEDYVIQMSSTTTDVLRTCFRWKNQFHLGLHTWWLSFFLEYTDETCFPRLVNRVGMYLLEEETH